MRGPAGRRRRRPSTGALLAVALLLPVAAAGVAGAVAITRGFDAPFSFWGDKAVEETAVQQAVDLDRSLGPHSNWGFFHPGPAMFYALGPLYRLTDEPLALALGALALNTAAGLGVVAVVLRCWGRLAGAVALAVVAAHLWSWTGPGVWEHWNPALVPLPLLLTTVLAMAAWRGSVLALLGACATGSFVAQTHLGSSAPVLVVLALGALGLVVARRRAGAPPDPTRRRRVAAAVLGVALAALWAPPVVQQLTADPGRGNLATVVEVAREGPPLPPDTPEGWPLRTAWPAVVHEATRTPFGTGPAPQATAPVDLADVDVTTARWVAWCAVQVLALACVAWGLRTRRLPVAALGAATLALSAATVAAAVRVPGTLFNYQLWGGATALAPAVIGIGAVVGAWLGARQVLAAAAVGALGIGLVAAFAADLERPGIEPYGDQALALSAVVEDELDGRAPVVVDWHRALDAGAPGVVATLRRRGVDVRVHETREPVFGRPLIGDRTERQRFLLAPVGATRGQAVELQPDWACSLHRVGATLDAVVWLADRPCRPSAQSPVR